MSRLLYRLSYPAPINGTLPRMGADPVPADGSSTDHPPEWTRPRQVVEPLYGIEP